MDFYQVVLCVPFTVIFFCSVALRPLPPSVNALRVSVMPLFMPEWSSFNRTNCGARTTITIPFGPSKSRSRVDSRVPRVIIPSAAGGYRMLSRTGTLEGPYVNTSRKLGLTTVISGETNSCYGRGNASVENDIARYLPGIFEIFVPTMSSLGIRPRA